MKSAADALVYFSVKFYVTKQWQRIDYIILSIRLGYRLQNAHCLMCDACARH